MKEKNIQKKRMDIQKEYMEAKDERMRTTAQTFNIIKSIAIVVIAIITLMPSYRRKTKFFLE